MKSSILAAVTLALVACGGTAEPNGVGTPVQCVMTLSGAKTGTENCSAAISYGNAANQIGGAFSPTTAFPGFSVQTAFVLSGTSISAGTYQGSSFTSIASTVSDNAGGTVWVALAGSQATGTAAGTQTLVLSSTGTQVGTSVGGVYVNAHGTFDATLPAASGTAATGTVTMHVVF